MQNTSYQSKVSGYVGWLLKCCTIDLFTGTGGHIELIPFKGYYGMAWAESVVLA